MRGEIINRDLDKIPPQALEIERKLLGILIDEEDIFLLKPLKSEYFYRPEHQEIYKSLVAMNDKKIPFDIVSFLQYSREMNLTEKMGGAIYVTGLLSMSSTSHRIDHYISVLKEKHLRRECIRKGRELIEKSFDESSDIVEVLEDLGSIAFSALNQESGGIVSIGDTIPEIKKTMENNQFDERSLSGIPTGSDKMDNHTGGWQKGDFTVIAAYSGDGKTSKATNIAEAAAREGFPTHIESLEMPKTQITTRIISQASGVSSKRIRSYKLDNKEVNKVFSVIDSIEALPIYYQDKVDSKIGSICASIRLSVLKYGVKLAIVDYIQLCQGVGETEERRLSNVTRSLKSLAIELNISIIGLAQFTKTSERHIPPRVGQLKGSGAIENDADNIILLWRADKYLKDGSFDFGDTTYYFKGGENKGLSLLDFTKGRNIGTGEWLEVFKEDTTTFSDYQKHAIEDISQNQNFYEKDHPF